MRIFAMRAYIDFRASGALIDFDAYLLLQVENTFAPEGFGGAHIDFDAYLLLQVENTFAT
jgi:hypothetical protein